jgi:outer membrane lipoprotein-sorting protein
LKLTADKGLNTLAFFLLLLAAVLPASAEGGQRFTAQPSAAVVQNGTEFVDKLLHSATTIGAYRVTADLAMQKKGKLSKTVAQFTFKAPSLLRVDVLSGGMNTGAAVAVRADGGICAKGGPALFGLKMNLEKGSRLLRLPNGLLVTGCDFASLVRWLKLQAKSGADVSVSAMPLKIDELSNVIVVELRDSGPFSASVAQRVLVDPSRMLPVEWILFKEGALLSSTKFRNLELLPQVDESIFQL